MVRRITNLVAIGALLVVANVGITAPEPLQRDTQSKALVQTELDLKSVTLTLGSVTVSDSAGIRTFTLGSTNGTKIGATGDKAGFLGATPIVRPSSTTDLRQALINLGLYTTGGATPLNLNGGAFTAAAITGTTTATLVNLTVNGAATVRAGSNFSLLDSSDSTKRAQFDLSNIGTGQTRTVNVPNANSTTVQPSTAPATQFATGINAQGTLTYAQPDYDDLIDLPVLPETTVAGENNFLTEYDAETGEFAFAQPAFSNLSGAATAGQIPNLDAAKITTGAFDPARIPSLDAAKITTGEFDPARIPELDFSKITTGIVPKAQLPAVTAFTDANNIFTLPQEFISHTTGSVTIRSLATPGGPTVTTTGVAGASTWSYRIVAKLGDGTGTPGGSSGSTATGNATLDTSNWNNVSWTAVPGAVSYDVYRTAVGLVPSTLGKISNVTATTYQDKGAAGDLAAVPSSNSTGNVQWLADNTSDIGGTGANRPRNVNAASAVNAPAGNFTTATITTASIGTNTVTGNSTIAGTQVVTGNLSSNSQISNLDEVDVSRAPYSVDMTGVADSTTGFNNAIVDAQLTGKAVYKPAGTILITSQITITAPVTFRGPGVIKWGGASGGTMMRMSRFDMSHPGYPHTADDTTRLIFDGNNLAGTCLELLSVSGGKWDVMAYNWLTGYGLKCTGLADVLPLTSSYKTFVNLNLASVANGGACLFIGGSHTIGNDCHNTFINTKIVHGGTKHAILIGGADNNTFLMTFIYRAPDELNPPTGSGVRIDSTEEPGGGLLGPLPTGVQFFHLQAGLGGWVQPDNFVPNNPIYSYMQDNGQPAPVAVNGNLFWISQSGGLNGVANIASRGDIVSATNITSRNASTTARNVIGVEASDFPSSFRSIYLMYGDSAAPGSYGSIPWANTGALLFQNATHAWLGTNNAVPLEIMYNAGVVASFDATGLAVKPSTGTAVFNEDASSSDALYVLTGEVAQPFGNSSNFGGMFTINDPSVSGSTAVFVVGGPTVLLGQSSSAGTNFTTTAGTAGHSNVYTNGNGAVEIQNLTGAPINYRVVANMRMRSSN